MNKEQLKNILPHREPMLLLDDSVKIDEVSSLSHYKVKGDEFFLQGHFPNNPILPGVIQCEIMAQSCAVILNHNTLQNNVENNSEIKIPLFTGINNCKFKGVVKPDDLLTIESKITKIKEPFFFAKSTIKVNERVVSSADISFCLVKKDV